jgi:hypothetical protein
MTLATRLSARSLVNLGAIITTLVCGLGVPLLYLIYEYEERAELLEFKASLRSPHPDLSVSILYPGANKAGRSPKS